MCALSCLLVRLSLPCLTPHAHGCMLTGSPDLTMCGCIDMCSRRAHLLGVQKGLTLSASSACALLNRAFALLGTRSRTLLQSIFAASASPNFSVLAALHEAIKD